MSIQGLYQNDITTLQKLDLQHYERIFKVFDEEINNKVFYFYNILRKIDLPDNIDSTVTSLYEVKTTLPLTILSYNIYGDIRLWWLLLLLNKQTIGENIFMVPGGVQIKYILPQFLESVFTQITNLSIFNGRHY